MTRDTISTRNREWGKRLHGLLVYSEMHAERLDRNITVTVAYAGFFSLLLATPLVSRYASMKNVFAVNNDQ